MKRIFITIALLLGFSSVSWAEKSFQETDAKLNTAYKEIKQRLNDNEAASKRFTESQRTWLHFRDAECAFQTTNSEDGSAYPMLAQACMLTLTENRLKDFERYLNCQEGDLTCPVPTKE